MLVVPISNSTSRLNIGTETASKVVPVVKNCGWKPSGLPSEQYTSVPLACTPADRPAASAARIVMRNARRVTFMTASLWGKGGCGGMLATRRRQGNGRLAARRAGGVQADAGR